MDAPWDSSEIGAHGKTAPRWDCSTAAGLLVLGALVWLAVVKANFRASASAGIG